MKHFTPQLLHGSVEGEAEPMKVWPVLKGAIESRTLSSEIKKFIRKVLLRFFTIFLFVVVKRLKVKVAKIPTTKMSKEN